MTDTTRAGNHIQLELEEQVRRGAEAADNLYETVAEVKAVNTSPVIPGGPRTHTIIERDGTPYWEGIRPTALRGVWRWWVRTLLAGLLLERCKKSLDYTALIKLEEKRLGMGTVSGNDIEASRLVLALEQQRISEEPLNREKFEIHGKYVFNKDKVDLAKVTEDFLMSRHYVYEDEPWKALLSIPRYALLTMGKVPRDIGEELYLRQPIPPGKLTLKVSLKVRRDPPLGEVARAIGTAALITALTLGGVGQATSRGFGKMEVDDVRGNDLAKNLARMIRDLGSGARRRENFIEQVMNYLTGGLKESGEDLCNLEEVRKASTVRDGLPNIPTFHHSVTRMEVVRNPRLRFRNRDFQVTDVWKALVAIGRACLKTEWKALCRLGYRASGKTFHTWPLGLPRSSKIGGRRTGYFISRGNSHEVGRLQSLVRFSIIQAGSEPSIIVYAFKTADLWKLTRTLVHMGKRKSFVNRLQVTDPSDWRRCRILPQGQQPAGYLEIAFNTVVKLIS